MVSGLIQSEGEGERSRLVTGACRPSASPAPAPNAEPPRCAPPRPSPGMPFSDRNSSRSTYCNTHAPVSTRTRTARRARALTHAQRTTYTPYSNKYNNRIMLLRFAQSIKIVLKKDNTTFKTEAGDGQQATLLPSAVAAVIKPRDAHRTRSR